MKCRSVLTLLAFLCTVYGQEAPSAKEAIPVTEAALIEAQLGETASIRGKVTRTGQSKGGLQFINFANAQFVVVCFPDAVAKFKEGQPVEIFKDRTVEVTGKIVKYRDKFQIKLERPNQIKIVEEPNKADAAPKPAESKPSKKSSKSKPRADKDKKPVDPKKFFDC